MDAETAGNIKGIFRRYDVNGDGLISVEELSAVLSGLQCGNIPAEHIMKVFGAIDANNDGAIQYDELVNWLCDERQGWTDIRAPQSAVAVAHARMSADVGGAAPTPAACAPPPAASQYLANSAPPNASQGERAAPLPDILFELDGEEEDFVDTIAGLRLLSAKQLRVVFQEADVDRNGCLRLDELRALLFPVGSPSRAGSGEAGNSAIAKIFAQMDKNTDGKIGCAEFVSYLLQAKKCLSSVPSSAEKQHIARCFSKVDEDSSGNVSRAEMENMLGAANDEERKLVDRAFASVDENSDGVISVPEFSRIYGIELMKEARGNVEVEWKDVPEEEDDD